MRIGLAVVAWMVLCPASALAQTPGLGEFPGCEWRTVLNAPALFCPAGRKTMRRITSEGEFTPQTIEKAKAGDLRALATVGIAHVRHQRGLPEHGLAILQQAADKGDALAQRKLGERLIDEDDAEAELLLTRAADQGDAPAMTALARLLSRSAEDDARQARVKDLRLRAATLGDVEAMLALEGDAQDPDEKRRWLLAAAEAGSDYAMHVIARGYERGAHGFPKDAAESHAWDQRGAYRKAADLKRQIEEQRDLVPMVFDERGGPAFHLAEIYNEDRFGVPRDIKAAEAWLRLGVEHGDPDAAADLKFAFEYGREGFRKDPAEAARLDTIWEDLELDQMTANANAGWTPQMLQLADYHLTGASFSDGLSDRLRDHAEGVRWVRRLLTLEPDSGGALLLMARAYREGLGVAKDTAEADRLQARAVALYPDELAPLETVARGMPDRSAGDILAFALRHYREGSMDEAVFWWMVAQLRRHLEVAKGATLSQGLEDGFHVTSLRINQYATGNVPKFMAAVDRALAWDEAHPLPGVPDAARAKAREGLTAFKAELKRDQAKIRRLRRKEGLPETTP